MVTRRALHRGNARGVPLFQSILETLRFVEALRLREAFAFGDVALFRRVAAIDTDLAASFHRVGRPWEGWRNHEGFGGGTAYRTGGVAGVAARRPCRWSAARSRCLTAFCFCLYVSVPVAAASAPLISFLPPSTPSSYIYLSQGVLLLSVMRLSVSFPSLRLSIRIVLSGPLLQAVKENCYTQLAPLVHLYAVSDILPVAA